MTEPKPAPLTAEQLDAIRERYERTDNDYYDVRELLAEVSRLTAELADRDAKIAAVRELADSLVWERPAVSPCAPDFPCCGTESDCDAMKPSIKVVGAQSIRAALGEVTP